MAKRRRIAIVGAGFAGLSVAWHLLHQTQGVGILVDLFDPTPIGKGISGSSSGLLHTYTGKHAKKPWEADRAEKEAHELLTVAAQAINQSVITSRGIVRPALTPSQIADFQAAVSGKEAIWWDRERALRTLPGLTLPEGGGALYVPGALTLNVPLYLEGLMQACLRLAASYHPQALMTEQEFAAYDCVVFATGYKSTFFKPLDKLPLTPVKGQTLRLRWPQGMQPLPYSLVSNGYLVMEADHQSCIVGATYEREFTTIEPDLEVAKKEILGKVAPFFPAVEEMEILSCQAGVRAGAGKNNHIPLLGRVPPKYWFFTGLGSKGLLYHGWLGRLLAEAILADNLSPLPIECLTRLN